MRTTSIIIATTWLTSYACLAEPEGMDWPHWRGLDGNGVSSETQWRTEAIAAGPKILWKAEVGAGYSAISIQGERAFTMGNVADQDIVTCLDTETGKEVWRHVYACKGDSYPGPRATPAVDGDRVYTFGRAGHVYCLDAKTGTIKWQRNVASELQAQPPRWGFASSPVIADGSLLLNAGPRGVALDKSTGRTLWDSGPGVGGYAAVVPARMADKPTLLTFGAQALLALDPINGQERWSLEWKTSYEVNAADPVPIGDNVWITSGYGRGCALLDCAGALPRIVWENKAISAHFSSAVLHEGYLYGMDGNAGRKGNLVCQNPETGAVVWSEPLGFGSLILAGQRLIVLNEKGALFIVAASPNGYRQLASADDLLSAKCWTAPTLSRGRLYLRNDKGTVLCLDLR